MFYVYNEAITLKKKKFAIISGAGPMAGNLLYQRTIELLQCKGAWKDADFPYLILVNVPFSEMLTEIFNDTQVRGELIDALTFSVANADYVYIACQTLHAFLTPEEIEKFKVVSLLSLTNTYLIEQRIPAVCVVASKTSRNLDLHPKAFSVPCEYIEHERAENSIDDILKGSLAPLDWLKDLAVHTEKPIVLGCTEFSVAMQLYRARYIDPIELAANDIVQKFLEC